MEMALGYVVRLGRSSLFCCIHNGYPTIQETCRQRRLWSVLKRLLFVGVRKELVVKSRLRRREDGL